MSTETRPADPVWIPAHGVALQMGMTPRTFVKDCEAGRLPIRVHRVGNRGLTRVLSADVNAYLQALAVRPNQGDL
jgi:hypothetical protein